MQNLPTQTDACDTSFVPVVSSATPRRAASRPSTTPVPAAVDEVFANLANKETARRADVRSNARPLAPGKFRDLATEMDRQHERLAQLLRDIDG